MCLLSLSGCLAGIILNFNIVLGAPLLSLVTFIYRSGRLLLHAGGLTKAQADKTQFPHDTKKNTIDLESIAHVVMLVPDGIDE
jgi:hypothetical protein